jgi:hypothetical protein
VSAATESKDCAPRESQITEPELAGSARGEESEPFSSAILLHIWRVRAQCDYNATRRRGPSGTAARPLKSTSIQYQSNVRQVADAPDSKPGPCKRCQLKSHLPHELRRAGRISLGRLPALERHARRPASLHPGDPLPVAKLVEGKLIRQALASAIHGSFHKATAGALNVSREPSSRRSRR